MEHDYPRAELHWKYVLIRGMFAELEIDGTIEYPTALLRSQGNKAVTATENCLRSNNYLWCATAENEWHTKNANS